MNKPNFWYFNFLFKISDLLKSTKKKYEETNILAFNSK